MLQILSITCDNTSNNDTMMDELAVLIPTFPGAINRTRCFAHILNLVVKRILSLFDDDSDDAAQSAEKRLHNLASALDLEDDGSDDDTDDFGPDRSVSVSVDAELEALNEGEDLTAVRAAIEPVRAVIAKVRRMLIEH